MDLSHTQIHGIFAIPDMCDWISLQHCSNITDFTGEAKYMNFRNTGMTGVITIPTVCKWLSLKGCTGITGYIGDVAHMTIFGIEYMTQYYS